jgi:hypothetical protein
LANEGGLAAAPCLSERHQIYIFKDEPELPAGLSLGMPPANRPPICGGPALPPAAPAEVIVGALCAAPPPPPLEPATAGALLSFVTAFLRLLPA